MVSERRLSFAEGKPTISKRVSSIRKRSQSLSANDPRHRRLLAPRKSILKQYSVDTTTEDADATTRSDFDPRKSLNRRVSFAQNVSCRFIQNEQNTNSSGGPSSSPEHVSPQQQEQPDVRPMPKLSNENDYPGRRTSFVSNRRVTMGSEYGDVSMSMELDSSPVKRGIFLPAAQQEDVESSFRSATDEDELDDDEEMEITEAIALNIHRKRSLSIAQQKDMAKRSSMDIERRLSRRSLVQPPGNDSVEDDEAEVGDTTTTSQGSEGSEAPVEFTVPLGQSLRPPRPPSDAWLALQAITNGHSEVDDEEGSDMELTSAISRLQRMRDSLSLGRQDNDDNDASYTSMEDDSIDGIDMGDRTLNLTGLLGGVKDLELTEELPEDQTIEGKGEGGISVSKHTLDSESPQYDSGPSIGSASSSQVFAPPTPDVTPATSSQTALPQPSPKAVPSVFVRPPSSPTKQHPPSKFKPPRVFAPRSSSPVERQQVEDAETGRPESPTRKRLAAPAESLIPQPSPLKKRAIETDVSPLAESKALNHMSSDKLVPAAVEQSTSSVPAPKTSFGPRRPSGYFAKRRSLAPGTKTPFSFAPAPDQAPGQVSPEKQVNRRASIAGVPLKGKVQDENRPAFQIPSRPPTEAKIKAPPPPPPTRSVTSNQLTESIEEVTEPATEGDFTEQWRLNIPEEPALDEFEEDLPPISIEEFLTMTGVKFMDELTIPRRSIHPSQMRSHNEDLDTPIAMVDYITAMNIHMPQLELYSWVAKDLQAWIDNNKKTYREAEEEVSKVTPTLFHEYSLADEQDRADLLHQMKLIKVNKQLAAKGKWYEWKQKWIENLYEMADKGFAELQADEKALNQIVRDAEDLLPALREQHVQILQELEKERAEIEDIERSDPAYLEELKIEIEEQNVLLETYRTELSEGNAKLERLEEKFSELDLQRKDNLQAIEDAKQRITIHKNSSRSEVFRLKDELEALQALHSWRLAKASPDLIELAFEERFLVSIPCEEHRALSWETTILRIEPSGRKREDPFPLLSELAVTQGEAYVRGLKTRSIKPIVECLSDFWTSCAAIRKQINFLKIKYPLKLETLPKDSGGFKATASLLLKKYKSKVLVSFEFNEGVLRQWPFMIKELKCDVKIVYGAVDSNEIRSTISERLSEATMDENHTCLLDACVEAASRYDA